MKPSLLRVIIPTPRQAFSCVGISVLIMVSLYHQQILERVRTGALTSVLGQISYANWLSELTKAPIARTLVIVAFWSAIGLVAYTLVWSLINVLIEARNEVVLETAYTNKADFGNRIKTPLMQLGLAATLFMGLFLCARLIFPFWLTLSTHAIASSNILVILGLGLGSILGMALTIYVLLLLGQLIFWLG